jgi:CBS domain containing-hemolysin-like protein
VDLEALRGVATAGEALIRPFNAYVTAQDSLRQALDSIVTNRTQVAVVASEGQRYLGILTLSHISEEITS